MNYSIGQLVQNLNELLSKRYIFKISTQRSFKILFAVIICTISFSKVFSQIAQRGTATSASISGNTSTTVLTINKPTGVVAGDIMIASISQYCNNSGATAANLSGWTKIDSRLLGGTKSYATILYKVATSTEPSSYSFNITLPNYTAGTIVAFSGVNTTGGSGVAGVGSGPFDATTGTITTSGSQSISATSITTANANAAVVMLGFSGLYGNSYSAWTTTSPGSLTELSDVSDGGDWCSTGVAWKIKATAGATGAGSVTFTGGNGYQGGILLALKGTSCSSPTVSATTVASSITGCSASTGGNITADGGCPVTERGVCYATTANPTTANAKVTASGTTGSFSSSITGLTPGLTYYVRAYAINSNGTTYGTQISFTTSSFSAAYSNSPFTFCENTAISNQTPVTNGSPNSFSVTPALPTGILLNSATGVLSGTPSTTFTSADYTISYSNASGCNSNTTINIAANSKPTSVTAGSNTSICLGNSTSLSGSATGAVVYNAGTLYTRDFSGDMADWQTNNVDRWYVFTENNSAGGTAPELGYSGGDVTITVDANASLKNYINATGWIDLKMSFKHMVDRAAGTAGILSLETTTDGNVWTPRWTFSTNTDVSGTTVSNVDLSAVNGQNFRIRFRINGQNGNIYYWFVDDVIITGKQASNASVTYAWASSPEGFSSSSNAPGSVTPLTSTTYIMTATSNGCSVSSPVTISISQPNTTIAVSGILLENGDYLWNGNTNTNAVTTSNWYQKSSGNYVVATQAPTSSNRVFVVPTSLGGNCISGSNLPAITSGSFNAKDFIIENGSSFNLGSSTLGISGNFINNGTFNTGTGTVTLNGNTAQTIDGSGSLLFYGLTLNNSAGVTLAKNLEVSNSLTLTNGHIRLGSKNLTLGAAINNVGGTMSASKMIVASGAGELRKKFTSSSSFLFPVGTTANGNEYSPVTLSFNSGVFGEGAYVSARVSNARTSAMNTVIDTYIDRNWIVEPFNILGFNYNILLDYLPTDVRVGKYSASDIVPVKVSSGQWYQPDAITTAFTNTIIQGIHNPFANGILQWDGLTTFSEFGGAAGTNEPLPVELLSFSGSCEESKNSIEWQTASEHNCAYFDLQKSRDGENWQTIQTLTAAGNSNEHLTYNAIDENAHSGNNYYRLNQVDNDGKSKLYGPILVSCAESNKAYVTTYPNPSGSNFNLLANNLSFSGESELKIFDSRGFAVISRTIEIKDGINLFVIDETLSPGIYFISISNGEKNSEVVKHIVK